MSGARIALDVVLLPPERDLAIQGDGLFVVSDGTRSYYTRAGNFQLDANGKLVSPANGFKVQGINADSNGVLSTGSAVQDIARQKSQQQKRDGSADAENQHGRNNVRNIAALCRQNGNRTQRWSHAGAPNRTEQNTHAELANITTA